VVTGMGRMRLFGHVECKDDIDWINCTAVRLGRFHLWINMWVAGKTICPLLTCAILERLRGVSMVKHFANVLFILLYNG